MPASCWRGRRDLSWPFACNDVAVPHRIVTGGELEQPVEDQAAASRAAPVEAEHELIQVTLQMRFLDRALMRTQQPPLGQRGDPVHRGQQLARVLTAGAGRALAAPLVDIAEPGQPVIAHPGVGDDRRARLNMAGDERVQRGRRPVRQQRHPAPADPLRPFDLHRDAGQDLLAPGPAAAQPRLLPADIGLVHLHPPGQPVPARAHQHRPQAAQHRPRRLVRADLQRPLQAECRDPVLGRGEQPACGEPHRQRRPRPVEDRARRHRGAPVTTGALIPAIAELPASGITAGRAGETTGPAQPLQVVETVGVGAEPCLELAHGPGVMPAATKPGHHAMLLRLNGDP